MPTPTRGRSAAPATSWRSAMANRRRAACSSAGPGAARGAGGMLLGEAGIGQVEEVYTAKAHRGAGLASAVVRTAIAAARERGDDLVMIMADADDWPQRLYERLGFEPVDVYRTFTKKPT